MLQGSYVPNLVWRSVRKKRHNLVHRRRTDGQTPDTQVTLYSVQCYAFHWMDNTEIWTLDYLSLPVGIGMVDGIKDNSL